MAFHQLNKNSQGWKNLPDREMNSQLFYPIQQGKGTAITGYLPPMQGIIEKAKVKLRRQIKNTVTKKKTQSKVRKRPGKTAPKRKPRKSTSPKKRTNKPKPKPKTKKRRKTNKPRK